MYLPRFFALTRMFGSGFSLNLSVQAQGIDLLDLESIVVAKALFYASEYVTSSVMVIAMNLQVNSSDYQLQKDASRLTGVIPSLNTGVLTQSFASSACVD